MALLGGQPSSSVRQLDLLGVQAIGIHDLETTGLSVTHETLSLLVVPSLHPPSSRYARKVLPRTKTMRQPQTTTSRTLAVRAGVWVLPPEVCALYIRVLPRGIVVSGGACFPATADAEVAAREGLASRAVV